MRSYLTKFSTIAPARTNIGGPGRGALMMVFSYDEKDTWANGILENSQYSRIRIGQRGEVENFSGTRPFMRKFTAKSLEDVIRKIGIYINQRKALDTNKQGASAMDRGAVATSLLKLAKEVLSMEFPN